MIVESSVPGIDQDGLPLGVRPGQWSPTWCPSRPRRKTDGLDAWEHWGGLGGSVVVLCALVVAALVLVLRFQATPLFCQYCAVVSSGLVFSVLVGFLRSPSNGLSGIAGGDGGWRGPQGTAEGGGKQLKITGNS